DCRTLPDIGVQRGPSRRVERQGLRGRTKGAERTAQGNYAGWIVYRIAYPDCKFKKTGMILLITNQPLYQLS
ncbi:MAG TPA: hypothetical protein VER03_02625, partial [Bryobacteraceae bacterium]|nr:hypothetical protein [Bryobacteraceae bacterium]